MLKTMFKTWLSTAVSAMMSFPWLLAVPAAAQTLTNGSFELGTAVNPPDGWTKYTNTATPTTSLQTAAPAPGSHP